MISEGVWVNVLSISSKRDGMLMQSWKDAILSGE